MDARPHIEAELARLERRLPVLTGQCEPDLALEAFAREARPLTADPPAELEAYIHQRLNCMLAEAGLAPEGELCTRQG